MDLTMPRDTPPIALPALAFTDTDAGALRYGGYPHLPAEIDWPYSPSEKKPMNFLAEIDLAALPREMKQAGLSYSLPDFPQTGKLFLFLPLWGDMIYQNECVALYARCADQSTPLRKPPEDIPPFDLDDLAGVYEDAVAEDGCSLKEGYMAATAFLSHRAENTLWRNMDRAHVSEEEIYERDKAFAAQLQALGIDYDVPLPSPEATREPLYDQIPIYYQGYYQKGVMVWDWRYIFEVAKHAFAGCYDLPIEQINGWIEDGDDRPRYRKVLKRMEAKRASILGEDFADSPGWWERFSCDHIPALNMRIDVQLRRWMGYARVSQKRTMTEEDKAAFVALLQLVDDEGNRKGLANLRVLTQFREHGVKKFYIEQVLKDAFGATAELLQHLHPERSLKANHDFGEADAAARHVQMFGAGYLCQHAAIEHEDKVMLFQISDACGIEVLDGVMQLWIAEDDLANARFSKTIVTLEST